MEAKKQDFELMFSSECDQHLKVKSIITIYIQTVNYFYVSCSANDKGDIF